MNSQVDHDQDGNLLLDYGKRMPPGSFIHWHSPIDAPLPGLPKSLRADMLNLLHSTYRPTADWPFRENPDADSPANVETLTWAIWALKALGEDEWVTQLRQNQTLLDRIDTFYDQDRGFYCQTNSQRREDIGTTWRLHNDDVVRAGLRMLGVEARPFAKGLDKITRFPWAPQPGEPLEDWLENCWAACGAKEIVQYAQLLQRLTGQSLSEPIHQLIRFVLARRDTQTGYVGMLGERNLALDMCKHRNNIAHLLFKPLGLREPEPWQLRVMETTFSLQNEDGLFGEGGMCFNLDAMELLVEYGIQTGRHHKRVVQTCRRAIRGMLNCLWVPGGGICLEREPVPANADTKGYGEARVVNGTAFFLETIRIWQALDPLARENMDAALGQRP